MSTLPNGPGMMIWYNGVLFPVESQSTITERPVLDKSKRTVREVVYTIHVKATLGQSNQPSTTDATMAALRQLLMQVAGELHVENTGYGPLVANVPYPEGPTVGTAYAERDVRWGPIPKMLKWIPKGQLAAEVEWQIEVALEPCDNSQYALGILEYVFGITYENGKNGYTRRTVKGSVSIPQTRPFVTTRTLSDSADRLREQVAPALPNGFRRERSTFDLSEDKCTLEFTFVDAEEGPNYLPTFVVASKMSHEVASAGGGGNVGLGGRWSATLRATYEVVRGTDRGAPYYSFLNTFWDRSDQARRFGGLGAGGRGAVIVTSFRAAEPEVYGVQSSSFELRYTFFASLQNMVQASGLWRYTTDGDWRAWATSMSYDAFHVRGNSKIKFNPSAEAIVDLCAGAGSFSATPPSGGPDSGGGPFGGNPGSGPNGGIPGIGPDGGGGPFGGGPDGGGGPFGGDGPDEFRNGMPPEDSSWLDYDSRLRIEQVDETIELKPLPPPGPQRVPGTPTTLEGGLIRSNPGGGTSSGGIPTLDGGSYLSPPPPDLAAGGSSGPVPDSGIPVESIIGDGTAGVVGGAVGGAAPTVIAQTRCPPTFYAYLEGGAVRGGYPIEPPALVSVGGCPVVPANRAGEGFTHELAGNLYGLPIYRAAWLFRYLIVGTPSGDLPVMDTPFGAPS